LWDEDAMFRLSIVIKGYSKNEAEIRSDRAYVEHYVTFLTSVAGGAWNLEEELLVLEDPTIEDLETLIDELKPDYVLLIMIGHGATQDEKQLFQINETTIIQAGQLALDVDKQLVILESCRAHTNGRIRTVDLRDRPPRFKYGGLVRRALTLDESRDLYNAVIDECENGLVVCYPCDDNEVATGYYYSSALLQRSFEWHLLNHSKYFTITQLMEFVSEDVKELSKDKQHPTITGTIGFPFAISKF